MNEPKAPLIFSGKDLKNMPHQEQEWIVDDLLRLGRKRLSLLLGKPEAGKSSLATQLAVAVSRGQSFLGRPTKQSEVLFWATEEDPEDFWESLERLGYDPDHHKMIWMLDGSRSLNPAADLRDCLAAHPTIRLVILETLDDVLRMTDLKDNSKAREAFEQFDAVVMQRFSCQAAFLGLHHLKKDETDNSGDAILGATVVRGRTDAKLYLKQVSDEDSRRVLHATVRKGRGIAKTFLHFDPTHSHSTLGATVKEEMTQSAEARRDKTLEAILTFFVKNPNTTFEKDCLPILEGHSDHARRIFKQACADGLLERSGTGKKGNAYTYRLKNEGRIAA
jgi:hypothetical protein